MFGRLAGLPCEGSRFAAQLEVAVWQVLQGNGCLCCTILWCFSHEGTRRLPGVPHAGRQVTAGAVGMPSAVAAAFVL